MHNSADEAATFVRCKSKLLARQVSIHTRCPFTQHPLACTATRLTTWRYGEDMLVGIQGRRDGS